MSDDVKVVAQEILDRTADQIGTHFIDCHKYHLACFAAFVMHALEASVQAPAVDKEALARLLHKQEGEPHEDWKDFRPNVEEVIASGILQDAAEVEARGLGKAIQAHRNLHPTYGSTAVCGGGIGGAAMTSHCSVVCSNPVHNAERAAWNDIESEYFRAQQVREGKA